MSTIGGMPTITARTNVYGDDAASLYRSAQRAGEQLAGKLGKLESVVLEVATEVDAGEAERGKQWGAVAVLTVTLPEPAQQPIVVPGLVPDAPKS